jgi:hypothetical protein
MRTRSFRLTLDCTEEYMTTRVILVSCVKSKRTSVSAAQNLYTSDLFLSMRTYARQNSDQWFILSAEHGVLRPDEVVAPYEKTLNKMLKAERLEWAARVQYSLLELIPSGASIVVLAGERYREGVVPFLRERGYSVEVPMIGLKFGFQLRWLKENTRNESPC